MGPLRDRLRCIEGQVRGLQRMVEEGRDCIDVLTQVRAVQGALDGLALELLDRQAHRCLARGPGDDAGAGVDDLMGAVGRFLRTR